MKSISFIVFFLTFLKDAESNGRLSQLENEKLLKVCGKMPIFTPEQAQINWLSGVKNGIVNGISIPGYIAPWSVHLVSAGTNCSGTIISPRHILSASHCIVEDPSIRNRVLNGSVSRCDEKDKDNIYSGIFNEIKVHLPNGLPINSKIIKLVTLNLCQNYDFWIDDIMILELDQDIVYSDYAQPVCTARDTTFNHQGIKIHMYTYGHNNTALEDNRNVGILRYGAMQIGKVDSRGGPYFPVHDRHQSIEVRAGDSGGGAISYEHGDRFVVGIVSHAKNGITYFTSVGHHFKQICAHTGVC